MDIKMIQKLQAAGVDASVILGLILDDEDQSHAAPAEVTPEPAASEPEPAPASTAPPARDPDPILSKLDQLIGTIQASNILRDGRESGPSETVDDILAKMISPAEK